MADFAIGECHDVPRVGVDTDQAGDFDVEPGFLFDFAHSGLFDGLADVVSAAG
ncbi:Uncharacterised protein [Mycobacterium tuberculosis]|nr:Uncharacterised protein [Mycobacterium tuberculosis]